MAFPDPSSLHVPCMVLSGLLVGMCKLPVTLFSAICECCADCHGYLIGSAWLVKFIVLSQERLSLGLLVFVLKHAEVKGCDKLLCKPVGAGSPEAQCSTLMTTLLVSHFLLYDFVSFCWLPLLLLPANSKMAVKSQLQTATALCNI